MSLIDVGLLAFSIGQMAKATKSLKEMLETPLTGMLNSISGTFKQLTRAIKTWQKNESTKTLTGMATAILILAGAMYVMSRINPDQFTEIASTVFGFVTLLTISAKLLEPTTKRFTKAFDSLKASALNAATVGHCCGADRTGHCHWLHYQGAFQDHGGHAERPHCSKCLSAGRCDRVHRCHDAGNASALSGACGGREGHEPQGDPFDGGGAGGAEWCHQGAFHRMKPLSEIKFTSLVKAGMAVVSLGGLLTTMATALAAVNKVIGPTGFQNGAAIAAMAGGIWIAAQAVSSLANIQLVRLDAAMTSIKTLMLLMTTMSAFSAKTKFGSGAAILVMSTSLVVLAGAWGCLP